MDIRKYAVEPTAWLHLRDSNDELMYADEGKTQPIRVELYGPGSKQHAGATANQSNRMLEKMRKKGKLPEMTAAQKTEEAAEFLAACTKGWEGMEYDQLQGDALSKAVYGDISIGFIADQVAKHLGDWSNFTKASPTN